MYSLRWSCLVELQNQDDDLPWVLQQDWNWYQHLQTSQSHYVRSWTSRGYWRKSWLFGSAAIQSEDEITVVNQPKDVRRLLMNLVYHHVIQDYNIWYCRPGEVESWFPPKFRCLRTLGTSNLFWAVCMVAWGIRSSCGANETLWMTPSEDENRKRETLQFAICFGPIVTMLKGDDVHTNMVAQN